MIPKRVVLDTNVCIDLFVFRDIRWTFLLNALKDRSIEAVTRSDCRMEWLIVLNYPHLPLNEESRKQAIHEFDSLITCTDKDDTAPAVTLPVCKDKDDQKFLEIALLSGACSLITKDKALLKLSKRTARAGLFNIMTPEAWTKAYGEGLSHT